MATDYQKPHDRDKRYVIIEGHGKLEMDDEIVSFGPSDFLFVPAGLQHRFNDFCDPKSPWVMFYSLDGGNNTNST